jgi:hypothetical protein
MRDKTIMKKKGLSLLTITGLIAAATGLYLALKRKTGPRKDAPPKAAPQLDIDNPGDQSEFPAAPQNERDLG